MNIKLAFGIFFGAGLLVLPFQISAQTVQASGNVNPFPSPNPRSDWNFRGESALYVGNTGTGSLLISNGSYVNNVSFISIGESTTAQGTVTVTGADSVLHSQNALYVGWSGKGWLTVAAGGRASSSSGTVGSLSGSLGTVTITGAGSRWQNYGKLSVGTVGAGIVSVENGGLISSETGYVGEGGSGTVTVTGTGSQWTNSGMLHVGYGGTGGLGIEVGGTVSNTDGYLGTLAGSHGVAIVSGANSQWNNSGALYIGDAGKGEMLVENGGRISSNGAYIGRSNGSTGSRVIVTGADSMWTNTGNLILGGSSLTTQTTAAGALTIEDGGTVWVGGTLRIFDGGSVTLDGGTIRFNGYNRNALGTFNYTSGTVQLAGSRTVETDAAITDLYGANPAVGANQHLVVESDLRVGAIGSGSLAIENGGRVSNALGIIGNNSGSFGEVTVSGAGSQWTNRDIFLVGYLGTGELTITDGGRVSNTQGFIGYGSGSSGTVTVGGADSQWAAGSVLYVGFYGTGGLTVTDGGHVSNTAHGYIGYYNGSSGTVTVSGKDSQWTSGGTLYVGISGTGELTVTDGGRVANTQGYVGYNNGSSGTATISGEGSRWTNSGDLILGGNGPTNQTTATGTLTIEDGGTVWVGGTLRIFDGDTVTLDGGTIRFNGYNRNTAGTFNYLGGTVQLAGNRIVGTDVAITDFYGSNPVIETNKGLTIEGIATLATTLTLDGGMLTVGGLNKAGGKINFDGGTLRALASRESFLQYFAAGDVEILSGGVFLDTQDFHVGVSAVIGGVGALVKQGDGALTLSGENVYTGDTVVEAGTLLVTGSTASASSVRVETGATLSGTGTIGGSVTVSGTLAPGTSPGLLTIDGDLTMTELSTLFLEFGGTGAGQFDQLFVGGIFTAGGTLHLDVGYAAAAGDSFTIFTSGGWDAGSFTNITTNLGGDLKWNTSDLASTGVITVIPITVIPEPYEYAAGLAALLIALILLRRFRVASR